MSDQPPNSNPVENAQDPQDPVNTPSWNEEFLNHEFERMRLASQNLRIRQRMTEIRERVEELNRRSMELQNRVTESEFRSIRGNYF